MLVVLHGKLLKLSKKEKEKHYEEESHGNGWLTKIQKLDLMIKKTFSILK